MRIKIIAFTASGCRLAKKMGTALTEHDVSLFAKSSSDENGLEHVDGSLESWTRDAFTDSDIIVFIGAVGIAVRSIAGFIRSKDVDPAVICVDEKGMFVIPILSGHIGGGNNMANTIADRIGAMPIVTTATDINKKFSVDSFASESGMWLDDLDIAKEISSRVLDGRFVGIFSRYPVSGKVPDELTASESGDVGIVISDDPDDSPFDRTLHLIPRRYVLGIGCRKNIPADNIRKLVSETLEDNGLSIQGVRSVASIDIKSDEPGLLEFCSENGIIPVFFSSEELNAVRHEITTGSDFVRSVTGTDNVCERSALAASKDGHIIQSKRCMNGVTIAIAEEDFEIVFRK